MSDLPSALEPRAWLPPAAVGALDIDGALSNVARAWSAKWFASGIARPLDPLVATAVASADGDEWLVLEPDLALAVAKRSRSVLPGLMLNLELPDGAPTAADERLLAELTQACLDDLCRWIAETFRLDAAARWDRPLGDAQPTIRAPMGCTIGIQSHLPLLRLVVAQDALVALAKARLPPIARQPRLSGVACGIAAQELAVSAHIGRCSLALADFAELGIGDVLVFDHPLDAPVDLVVNGPGTPLAKGRIVKTDDCFDLTLLESIGE